MASSAAASNTGTGHLPPTTTEVSSAKRSPAVAAKVTHLEQQLEANYRSEADVRLRQVLDSNPSGKFSDEDTAAYRQREANERESFELFKKTQVNNLINSLMAGEMYKAPPVHPSSFARPPPRGPSEAFRARPFPPPRPNRNVRDLSSEITATSTHSTAPRQSGSAPTSRTNAGAQQPEPKPENGLTREQVVDALFYMQDQFATSQAEAASVKADLDGLKAALREALEHMDNLGIAKRLIGLETCVNQAPDARALEAEKALIMNLTNEVGSLRSGIQELSASQDKFVLKQSYQAETELTKMTFHNKCNLIEKYLGIDITTTGPKPHDVLEALHKRVWQLESTLPVHNEGYKGNIQYASLNEFMKNPITKSNSMVNYSATPGYFGGNPGYAGATPSYAVATSGYVGATPGYMGATYGNNGYKLRKVRIADQELDPRGYTNNTTISQMKMAPMPAPIYMQNMPSNGYNIGFPTAPAVVDGYMMNPNYASVDIFSQRRNANASKYGPIYPADYSKMAEAQVFKPGATASGTPTFDDQVPLPGSFDTQVTASGPTHSCSPAYSDAPKLLAKDWRSSEPTTPQNESTDKFATAAVFNKTAVPIDRTMRNLGIDPDTYKKPGLSNEPGPSVRAGTDNQPELLDLSMALVPLNKSQIQDAVSDGETTPRADEFNVGTPTSSTVQHDAPVSHPDAIQSPTTAGASISCPVTALANSSEKQDQSTVAYRGWMNQKPGEFVGKKFEKLEKLGQTVPVPMDKDGKLEKLGQTLPMPMDKDGKLEQLGQTLPVPMNKPEKDDA